MVTVVDGRARRGRGDRGSTALMTAIIFPALLGLTLLIVQAGLYYHYKQRAAAAARQGAAAAAALGGSEEAGVDAAADFLANVPLGNGVPAPVVDVTIGDGEVTVTVVGSFDPLVPIGTSTVSASATAPLEEFVPETER